MGNSLFTLTSLNLNGIRSATSKGVEAWLEKTKPDCICVQEIKAQAPDMAGRFESLAGLQGHFQFAEKKGYSGVGVYTRHEPSDVIIGYGSSEFDAEGRYVELRFDRPGRSVAPKLSIISCYFPSQARTARPPSSAFWQNCVRTCWRSKAAVAKWCCAATSISRTRKLI